MSTKYLTAAETTKLIRKALKEAFPATKFSVRLSGGDAANIGWTDGPNARQVESVASRFAGAYFDGMQDYQGSITSTMDGEEVHFGTTFIFFSRFCSDFAIERAIRSATKYWGQPSNGQTYSAEDYRRGRLYAVNLGGANGIDMDVAINGSLSKWSTTLAVKHSPTAAGVAFLRAA